MRGGRAAIVVVARTTCIHVCPLSRESTVLLQDSQTCTT